jgi:hypothetical protein
MMRTTQIPRARPRNHGEHALLLIVATARRTLDRAAMTTMGAPLTPGQVADAVDAVPDRLPPSARPAVRPVLELHRRTIVRTIVQYPAATTGELARRVLAA